MIKRAGPEWITELIGRHSMMAAVLVPAFVDLDTSPKQVKLFPGSVFIETGAGYLILRIDGDSGQVQLAEGQVLEVPHALRAEPSIEPVFADLSLNYLDEVRSLQCSGVSLFLDADSSMSANQFRAIGFRFHDNRTLLFDPFWPSGLRIGGEFEAIRLRDENPEGSIVEISI